LLKQSYLKILDCIVSAVLIFDQPTQKKILKLQFKLLIKIWKIF